VGDVAARSRSDSEIRFRLVGRVIAVPRHEVDERRVARDRVRVKKAKPA